jgi:hypothetical protein
MPLRAALCDPQCDYPTGKSVAPSGFRLSSPPSKNISVFPKYKSRYMIPHPVPPEGRWPSSQTLGRDAVDAGASGAQMQSQGEMNLVSDVRRADEQRFCVRQNRVVLASVADAKSAEVFSNPTGFDETLIRWRR